MSEVVLVVDDEASIRRVLRTSLRSQGFKTIEAARGEEALSLVCANNFDAILLDINMPGMSGVDTCRSIRQLYPRIPILMLTVCDSEDDTVEALNAGADDYITKPFQLRELVARIRASMRWSALANAPDPLVLCIDEIELDPGRHTMKKNGTIVHLTPKEFQVIRLLMSHAGKPIHHSRLLNTVWGEGYSNELEYLRTIMWQLRMKIEDDPKNPKYLLTESHIGYRFADRV